MNYCSIDDAWGRCNSISNQFKNHMENHLDASNDSECKPNTHSNSDNSANIPKKPMNIEKFSNQDSKQNQIKNKQNYDYTDNNFDNGCDAFMNHIKTCRKCYNKMRYQFRSHLVENFQEIVEDNRDTIVLILLGISILLFFNLINNLTK